MLPAAFAVRSVDFDHATLAAQRAPNPRAHMDYFIGFD